MATDAVLNLYMNGTDGLVVYPKVIEQRLRSELPFMATENIMMDAVKKGADRQELHEQIRIHSISASKLSEGGKNDLLERIAGDPIFGVTLEELSGIISPEKYVGRAPQQTEDFIKEVVEPTLAVYNDIQRKQQKLIFNPKKI